MEEHSIGEEGNDLMLRTVSDKPVIGVYEQVLEEGEKYISLYSREYGVEINRFRNLISDIGQSTHTREVGTGFTVFCIGKELNFDDDGYKRHPNRLKDKIVNSYCPLCENKHTTTTDKVILGETVIHRSCVNTLADRVKVFWTNKSQDIFAEFFDSKS